MSVMFVTGGSRGIGRAVVELAVASGFSVAFTYHDSEVAARQLEQELKGVGSVLAVQCDVADAASVKEAVREARAKLGSIDVLVTSAGVAQQKLFTDLTEQDWKRIFDVNLFGTVHAIDAVLPEMISAKRGRIVTVASMWGEVGASCEVHYSASKAAVIGLTRALAKEVGPSGISVNCVSPGVIATDMLAGFSEDDLKSLAEDTPLGRIGRPEDVARAVLYLAKDASFVTGEIVRVNGGFVI